MKETIKKKDLKMEKCKCGCKGRCRCPWNRYLALVKSKEKLSLAKMVDEYDHEMRIALYRHPLLVFETRCCPIQNIGKHLNKIIQAIDTKIQ